jgi:F-type H+-transporting ATPase subunit epsilon
MKINIITPDKEIYDGEIKDARLIGIDGHFEILTNHAPMVAALAKGEIKLIDMENKEISFHLDGGLLEVSDNKIQIMAS